MRFKLENSLWVFALAIVAMAYIFGLFIDLTGDSGLYAAITHQMVESGDWFNLKINGVPYDQKPHLLFWLAGIGVKLFGNTNFAFKLVPFIYALAGIYFTFRLGKQIFSADAGKLAALITGTSQMFFLYLFDFHTDTVLQTGVALALWQLAAYLQYKKTISFIFGFIGIGLAMLAKGPVGAVLPFFVVFIFLLIQKDFLQLFHPKWILGIIITQIVISPSLIHLYNSFGMEGVKFFFITNNVGRITGEYAGSSTEWLFYGHTLLWAFLPWTLFVVVSFISEIKSWFIRKTEYGWSFYLLGSVLILLFILSVARGKAPNYFLITITPIAVVTANWLSRFYILQEKRQRILQTSQMVFAGLLFVFLIFIVVVYPFYNVWILISIITIFSAVNLLIFRLQLQQIKKAVLISVIVIGTLNLFFNAKVFPEWYSYQGARQVLEIYEEQRKPGDRLCNFELGEYELFFYAHDSVQHVTNWEELRENMKNPGTWLYTNTIKYNDIMKMNFNIDTVYEIKQRGMNRLNFEFLNPATRESSLKTNYLIVTSQ